VSRERSTTSADSAVVPGTPPTAMLSEGSLGTLFGLRTKAVEADAAEAPDRADDPSSSVVSTTTGAVSRVFIFPPLAGIDVDVCHSDEEGPAGLVVAERAKMGSRSGLLSNFAPRSGCHTIVLRPGESRAPEAANSRQHELRERAN
jgi:hypothetical protein